MMQQVAIALSVILGFLSVEFLGIHTGGLVSAGYLAFYIEQPYRLVATLALALIIYLAVRLISRFAVVYGSRRFMLAVLLSLVGTYALDRAQVLFSAIAQDTRVIGYIIPGLIASDMLKQGPVKTLIMVLILSFVIRMVLMTGVFG